MPFRVLVNGEPPGDAGGLDVDEAGSGKVIQPRLYQVIRGGHSTAKRTFEIEFEAAGVEAYVFG